MGETIRSYFRRRTGRALKVCAAGLVVCAMGITLCAVGYVPPGEIAAVIGVLIMCAGLWYLDLTRCPRCLSRLSATASSVRLRQPINFCPYCGADLDGSRP